MNVELQFKIQDLNARYVEAIDDDRLESWPDFFSDPCRYLLTTAENVARNLPIGIMYATSRAMLRDRIRALRDANVYEAQRYRHLLAPPRIIEAGAKEARARTHFMAARVMHSGETMLFATGIYDDKVVFDAAGGALFVEKTVIIDSRQVDTLLAIPL